jgi:3-deoxy-D-manno-octulosonic-acid transferase
MSLGEVLSARELVKELEKTGAEVVVSATTLTGLKMAKQTWPKLLVLPSPLDFSLSIRRFLNFIEPDLLIQVETDIWPGILLEMKKRNLATALVSARISPRSFKNYSRIRFFWGKVLKQFDHIAAQTEEDKEKLIFLGADPKSLAVTGNLKFDQPISQSTTGGRTALLAETGWPDGRWLVAGSTHMGEETIIMEAFKKLLPKFQDLKLLIAPRDRHKFGLTWRQIKHFFPETSARRSCPSSSDQSAKVFLLDSLGELESFYDLAEIALIGKSWPGSHEGGGHNPLEAAVRGKPVMAGLSVHNFKWMYQALSAEGGALIVEKQELASVLEDLLSKPDKLREMGELGQKFVLNHRGSVQETIKFLNPPAPK